MNRSDAAKRLYQFQPRLIAWTVVLFVTVAWGPDTPVRVFLIGDSTMADKPTVDNPERGWGQLLPYFFDANVVIENHARNGRSTKSFIEEGRWEAVLGKLRPGDYVFIQFGHNDEKISDTIRFASPHGAYKENLRRFVDDTRSKGATPVLLTPVQRRKFDRQGRLEETHGEYPAVVREVAAEQKVPLIDVTSASAGLFNNLGPERTQRIFLWVPDSIFESLPGGKQDNTHFNEYGATIIAGLVVDALKQSDLSLKNHLQPFSADSLPGLDKVVALDYYYNCEWRPAGAKRVQFHYVWEDTTDSGFSELGRTITRLGAYTTRVRVAPTLSMLSRYRVYVIVDPDTPRETDQPNYIEDTSAARIAEWVKAGGVLLLMANDRGNAEFEHFNRLASRFGIRFNEDSYHRVVGRDFEKGKFSDLPSHPIFEGVHQIYMKDLCSLDVATPAVPVLTEDGKVFIAVATFGKGTVLAVGDPWLYNEYYDSRKLPSSFENQKAGERLFAWLLARSRPVMNP